MKLIIALSLDEKEQDKVVTIQTGTETVVMDAQHGQTVVDLGDNTAHVFASQSDYEKATAHGKKSGKHD